MIFVGGLTLSIGLRNVTTLPDPTSLL